MFIKILLVTIVSKLRPVMGYRRVNNGLALIRRYPITERSASNTTFYPTRIHLLPKDLRIKLEIYLKSTH